MFTNDLDFGTLLFLTKATAPSVIQIRTEDIRLKIAGKLLVDALKKAKNHIVQGALVTIDPRKSRIRLLKENASTRFHKNTI